MQRCDLDPNILCKNAGVEMCDMSHNEVMSHPRWRNHGNTRKTQKNYQKLCTNPIQLFCSYPSRDMVFHSFYLSYLSGQQVAQFFLHVMVLQTNQYSRSCFWGNGIEHPQNASCRPKFIAIPWQPQIIRRLKIAVGRYPKINPKPQPGTSLLKSNYLLPILSSISFHLITFALNP